MQGKIVPGEVDSFTYTLIMGHTYLTHLQLRLWTILVGSLGLGPSAPGGTLSRWSQ